MIMCIVLWQCDLHQTTTFVSNVKKITVKTKTKNKNKNYIEVRKKNQQHHNKFDASRKKNREEEEKRLQKVLSRGICMCLMNALVLAAFLQLFCMADVRFVSLYWFKLTLIWIDATLSTLYQIDFHKQTFAQLQRLLLWTLHMPTIDQQQTIRALKSFRYDAIEVVIFYCIPRSVSYFCFTTTFIQK